MTPAELHDQLAKRFPTVFPEPPEGVPLVPCDHHYALAQFLKEALGFSLYVTVVGSHWPAEGEAGKDELEVATVLRRPTTPSLHFSWRVRIAADETVPSLFPLFAGADWQEREQYDLLGVHFADHPDLRRLMLPEDWEGYPLRREYPIETPHPPWR